MNFVWVKKVCGELSALCRHLQKLLTSKTDNNSPDAIETSLLCTTQIVCCIKYLEKALTIESNDGVVLTVRRMKFPVVCYFNFLYKIPIKSTRQFFLDRIMWCLSRIKTINDSSITADTSFVHLMDVALELIAPLTLFASASDTSNIAGYHAEVSWHWQYRCEWSVPPLVTTLYND